MKAKGTIMEINKNSMIIMTEDCGFQEIKKRQSVMEGMEIDYFPHEVLTKRKSTFTQKSFLSVAAVLIIMLISSYFTSTGLKSILMPTAVLTIDINPSISLELNQQQEVIRVKALNEDAKSFPLNTIKKKDVREAVAQIILWAEEGGYIRPQEDNYILLTTVSLRDEVAQEEELERLAAELTTSIEAASTEDIKKIVLSINSNQETLKQAEKENVSVGKMEIIRKTTENNNDLINIEEIKNKKVKDLVVAFEDKQHPVFTIYPKNNMEGREDGDASENDALKPHPVFDENPGNGKGQGLIKKTESKTDDKDQKVEPKNEKDTENEKENEKEKDNKDNKENKENKDKETVDITEKKDQGDKKKDTVEVEKQEKEKEKAQGEERIKIQNKLNNKTNNNLEAPSTLQKILNVNPVKIENKNNPKKKP